MNIFKLQKFIKDKKLPSYRFGQIVKAVYKDHILDFEKISTIPKELREELKKEISVLSFTPELVLNSDKKDSYKARFVLADGKKIETVMMTGAKEDWTVCVSSQVGCPLGCAFCATGSIDFQRNLNAEEISDQVLFWQGYLVENKIDGKVSNIVYMGMGEPFLNWPEVKGSLEILLDEKLFGFGSRSISVSTAGLPDGIKKLAQDFPQVNLAISLHSADHEKRSELMPINNANNLFFLHQAIEYYQEITTRKVFLEYIMLADFNDSIDDAKELIRYIRSFAKPYLLHVNLIPYNTTIHNYRPSSQEDLMNFKTYLEKSQISVTIRKSLGSEIEGACGQLIANKK